MGKMKKDSRQLSAVSLQIRDERRKLTKVIAGIFALIALLLLAANYASAARLDAGEILEEWLAKNYPWDSIEVSNVYLNGKKLESMPENIIVEKGPLGKAVFSFMMKKQKKVLVKAHVRAFGNIVKSKRPYKRGHVIRADDIYVSQMDIRRMPHSAVKDPASLIGKSFKRSIAANLPVVENMIEMSQVVKRGKRVVLVLNYGGLSITAYGVTKEKGYVGMPVRAINMSSKKEVVGILKNENTIEVEI